MDWISIGRLVLKEPFHLTQFLLCCLCLCGLILIIQPEFLFSPDKNIEKLQDRRTFIIGMACGIFASLVGCVVFMTIRVLKGKVSVVVIQFYFNFFSVIFGGIGMMNEGAVAVNGTDIFLMCLMGIFFYLAHSSRNRALYMEKPFVVGVLSYMQVIVSYSFDIFIFKTHLNFISILGCLIVMISIIFLMYYINK